MQIFVSYGYNERDAWIEQYVFPLLSALGCDVVHGKAVYGGAIPHEVTKLIRNSDALIGFTTRREAVRPGHYRTHEWVVQELLIAHTQGDPPIPWVEVREQGVLAPGGLLDAAGTQRIEYREEDRAGCLVKIAQAVRRFQDLTPVTRVRLGPAEWVEQISPFLHDPSFACTAETLIGVVQTSPRSLRVLPIKGGLFVQLRGLSRAELVRITVSARGRTWRSDYESVDTVYVGLKE
jgi:hypothetical protein